MAHAGTHAIRDMELLTPPYLYGTIQYSKEVRLEIWGSDPNESHFLPNKYFLQQSPLTAGLLFSLQLLWSVIKYVCVRARTKQEARRAPVEQMSIHSHSGRNLVTSLSNKI